MIKNLDQKLNETLEFIEKTEETKDEINIAILKTSQWAKEVFKEFKNKISEKIEQQDFLERISFNLVFLDKESSIKINLEITATNNVTVSNLNNTAQKRKIFFNTYINAQNQDELTIRINFRDLSFKKIELLKKIAIIDFDKLELKNIDIFQIHFSEKKGKSNIGDYIYGEIIPGAENFIDGKHYNIEEVKEFLQKLEKERNKRYLLLEKTINFEKLLEDLRGLKKGCGDQQMEIEAESNMSCCAKSVR